MALFGKKDPAQEATAQADREDQQRLAQGGLPLGAETRLWELRGKPFFTSSLSVNEFALAATEGVRPLGQVIGATVYRMSRQSPPFSSGELSYVTQAQLAARRLVFGRIQQEARLLGAHGVLGLKMVRKETDPKAGLIEWTAIGTAVFLPGSKVGGTPFLSALSGQDWWTLSQAGCRPVGLALGVCGYFQRGDCRHQGLNPSCESRTPAYRQAYPRQSKAYSGLINREDSGLTEGISQARSHAMRMLEGDALKDEASGVVNIEWEIDKTFREVEDVGETFRLDVYLIVAVLGTAVVASGSDAPAIDYALPLG